MNKKLQMGVMLVNRYGIRVKACCASCRHKCLSDFGHRCCELTGNVVRSKHRCCDWQMSEELGMLGCERGSVKRREYQLTLVEMRGCEDVCKTRADFEREQDSVYMDF